MKRYDRLIFVCTSDTCRAPMAEAIMQSKFLLEDLTIVSRGLVVLFPEPMNQKAEVILAGNGLAMTEHVSEMLDQEDFDERTLILVMEESQKNKIFEEHENVKNVFLLTEYIGQTGDVRSPYGGTLQDYGACYENMKALIERLVVTLNEEELLCK